MIINSISLPVLAHYYHHRLTAVEDIGRSVCVSYYYIRINKIMDPCVWNIVQHEHPYLVAVLVSLVS